jgi:hypothetical protein
MSNNVWTWTVESLMKDQKAEIWSKIVADIMQQSKNNT